MRGLTAVLTIFASFYFSQSLDSAGICDLPMNEGTGTEVAIYLYYDKAQDKCMPFRYTGQGGNSNRFTSEKNCIRNCSTKAETLYPMDESMACHFNKVVGECFGSYLRYYYDPIHQKCKKFLWTGCSGNGNRFLEQQQCNATCAGIKDDGDLEEEDEPDTPVSLILGLVFGILGAILLIVAMVLAVKKPVPKKSRRDSKGGNPSNPLREGVEMS